MSVPTGPKALTGSPQARRMLVLFLEALGGIRSTQEAADGMGVALVRYYQLETRLLQAMLEALEPRQKGRKPESEAACQARREKEREQLTSELRRYKSLCRSLQKVSGVHPPETKTTKGGRKKTRRIRKVHRGQRVVAAMLASTGEGTDPENTRHVKKEKVK